MQSTLERLYRKSLLHRQKSGRRYIYRTAVSRSVFISQLMMDIAETIGDGEMAPMVSGFVNYIDYESPESLTEEVREIIDRLPTQSDD
ncbi:MAG: BlaI/MecI/CopY family transcriptional regulator [Candidatus Thiodiazotropha taylori]